VVCANVTLQHIDQADGVSGLVISAHVMRQLHKLLRTCWGKKMGSQSLRVSVSTDLSSTQLIAALLQTVLAVTCSLQLQQ